MQIHTQVCAWVCVYLYIYRRCPAPRPTSLLLMGPPRDRWARLGIDTTSSFKKGLWMGSFQTWIHWDRTTSDMALACRWKSLKTFRVSPFCSAAALNLTLKMENEQAVAIPVLKIFSNYALPVVMPMLSDFPYIAHLSVYPLLSKPWFFYHNLFHLEHQCHHTRCLVLISDTIIINTNFLFITLTCEPGVMKSSQKSAAATREWHYLSISIPIYVYLSIYLSTYLSIYLSIYLSKAYDCWRCSRTTRSPSWCQCSATSLASPTSRYNPLSLFQNHNLLAKINRSSNSSNGSSSSIIMNWRHASSRCWWRTGVSAWPSQQCSVIIIRVFCHYYYCIFYY